MMEGYYNRPTQLLPKEDVAVVIWGNKITENISHTIRFQASKKAARKYLGIRRRTHGQTNDSTKLNRSIWIWRLKTNPTCTKFENPNRTLVSAAPEYRWDCI
jgi:hypothetical protein